MNKNLIFAAIVLLVLIGLVWKKKMISRADMIDFLNINLNHPKHVGKWVTLSDEDLRPIYKVFALIKQGVEPQQSDYIRAIDIMKKNNIDTTVF